MDVDLLPRESSSGLSVWRHRLPHPSSSRGGWCRGRAWNPKAETPEAQTLAQELMVYEAGVSVPGCRPAMLAPTFTPIRLRHTQWKSGQGHRSRARAPSPSVAVSASHTSGFAK